VFIDLEKTYDRVPREVLWAMKVKINEIQVRTEAGITDQFTVAVGLHLGRF
jgi:hypothetical protein